MTPPMPIPCPSLNELFLGEPMTNLRLMPVHALMASTRTSSVAHACHEGLHHPFSRSPSRCVLPSIPEARCHLKSGISLVPFRTPHEPHILRDDTRAPIVSGRSIDCPVRRPLLGSCAWADLTTTLPTALLVPSSQAHLMPPPPHPHSWPRPPHTPAELARVCTSSRLEASNPGSNTSPCSSSSRCSAHSMTPNSGTRRTSPCSRRGSAIARN